MDPREKARRDHEWMMTAAREEGFKEGFEQGLREARELWMDHVVLAGKVNCMQELLGEEQAQVKHLRALSHERLNELLADLIERWHSRNA